MGCSKNFATQTSGAGMFKGGGNRGGSGWYGGHGCGGFGASGGSGYLRNDLQNTVFAMGKGARDGGDPEKTGKGRVTIQFHSKTFQITTDGCQAFEEVARATSCDLDHLEPLALSPGGWPYGEKMDMGGECQKMCESFGADCDAFYRSDEQAHKNEQKYQRSGDWSAYCLLYKKKTGWTKDPALCKTRTEHHLSKGGTFYHRNCPMAYGLR